MFPLMVFISLKGNVMPFSFKILDSRTNFESPFRNDETARLSSFSAPHMNQLKYISESWFVDWLYGVSNVVVKVFFFFFVFFFPNKYRVFFMASQLFMGYVLPEVD